MVRMTWLLGFVLVFAALRLFLWKVWFYRDPVRRPSVRPGDILAPADGMVVYIKPFKQGKVVSEKLGEEIPISEIGKGDEEYSGDGWVMGIYMCPLDVHFNYAPVSGLVTRVIPTHATVNLPMVDMWEYIRLTYLRRVIDLFAHKYRLVNERNTVFLEGGPEGCPKIVLVEIADKFVNKIRCFVKQGDLVAAGDKVSFIERGSQVDLVIYDESARFNVKPGDRVTGAMTVVATYSGGHAG